MERLGSNGCRFSQVNERTSPDFWTWTSWNKHPAIGRIHWVNTTSWLNWSNLASQSTGTSLNWILSDLVCVVCSADATILAVSAQNLKLPSIGEENSHCSRPKQYSMTNPLVSLNVRPMISRINSDGAMMTDSPLSATSLNATSSAMNEDVSAAITSRVYSASFATKRSRKSIKFSSKHKF